MQGLPLHPALVHLPIGLAVVMPLIALILLVSMMKCDFTKKVWFLVVILQAVLFGTAYWAADEGHDDEHIADKVVSYAAIEMHEELAHDFEKVAGALLVVAALGLLKQQKISRIAQVVFLAGSVGLIYLAYNTGHSGGELVYKYNAGAAFMEESLKP